LVAVRRPAAVIATAALALGGLGASAVFLASPAAQAATITIDRAAIFDCQTLYAVGDNGTAKIDLSGATPTTTAAYVQAVAPRHRMDTMALGLKPGATSDAVENLVAYHWRWDSNQSNGLVLPIAYGATTGDTFNVPNDPESGGWSGGELNQLTGEIYFSGYEDTFITRVGGSDGKGGNYRMMKAGPSAVGPFVHSGELEPNTTSDALTRAESHVSSDMAVDAEGNIYLLTGGSAAAGKWLIRVVPGSDGKWRYSKVVKLTSDGTAQDLLSTGDVWGMAFLNGSLYALRNVRYLYRIDPITGRSTYLGSLNYSPGVGDTFRDLSSCQTAPVLRGVVYNDVNGDGVVPDLNAQQAEQVLADQLVELYDSAGTLLGTRQTDGAGGFSFILNNTNNADFYVRVAQPVIGGVNATQTWASGADSQNKVDALCYDRRDAGTPARQNGICRGNRADGIDPTTLGGPVADRGGFVSKVHVTTSQEVSIASFGFTTLASHGDAPDTFGTKTAAKGPSHLVAPALAESTGVPK
jgi:adhesin/invasin